MDPDKILGGLLYKIKEKHEFHNLKSILDIISEYQLCSILNPNSNKFGIRVHRLFQKEIENNKNKTYRK